MVEASPKVKELLKDIYAAVDRGETTLEEMLKIVMDSFEKELAEGGKMPHNDSPESE
jgi:hypothetical protein